MKILITSDNHLGFLETDPIRKDDSFNTFEEILSTAKAEEASVILQGGDLFHYNKPSRHTYNKTLQILQKHCLGTPKKDISISDFNQQNMRANIYNKNISVSMPILSIHGNHDDPSGLNSVSPMDVLHSSGLVNYFGKCDNVDEIVIRPIFIENETVKIALYGLGHIKDRRLYQTFLNKKVTFIMPDKTGKKDNSEYFYICMVHQNRVPRENEYLPEEFLPDFFNLVIYGHEHESIKMKHKNFEVIQVGSSIRTSLCAGESGDKYSYLLEVVKNDYKIKRILLNTVRPCIIKSIKVFCGDFKDEYFKDNNFKDESKDKNFKDESKRKNFKNKQFKDKNADTIIIDRIEEFLKSYEKNNLLPLLRIRAEISTTQKINKFLLNSKIDQKIANPADWIRINRKKQKEEVIVKSDIRNVTISEIYLSILNNINLKCINSERIIDALNEFVEKDNKNAFSEMMNSNKEDFLKYISAKDLVVDDIENMIRLAKESVFLSKNDKSKSKNINDYNFENGFDYNFENEFDYNCENGFNVGNPKKLKLKKYKLERDNLQRDKFERDKESTIPEDSITSDFSFSDF